MTVEADETMVKASLEHVTAVALDRCELMLILIELIQLFETRDSFMARKTTTLYATRRRNSCQN